MFRRLLLIAMLLLPLGASAQVFSQNQIIIPPFGSNGWVVSTTTGNSTKLSASSTPYFSNFFGGTGTINNLTITGTCTNCGSGGASFPFTMTTNYGQTVFSSTTAFWAQGTPISLMASGTSVFANATSTLQTILGTLWIPLLTSGGLAVDGNGKVYKASTSTPSLSGGLSYSGGTLGSFLGGSSGTLTIASNALSLSQLPQVSANRFLGNASGAAANVAEVASSSFFSGTAGMVGFFSGPGALLGTSSLTVDTTQYIGAGSSTPWGLLSVNPNGIISTAPQFVVGSSSNTSFIVANGGQTGTGTTSPWGMLSINASSTVNTFTGPWITVGSTTGTVFIVGNNGYVGVGTTTPTALFSINASTTAGTNVPSFIVGSSTATNFIITSSGKVGVGSTTPFGAFGVNLASTTGGTMAFSVGSTSNAGAYSTLFSIDNVGSTTIRGVNNNQIPFISSNVFNYVSAPGANVVLTGNSAAPSWQSTFTIGGTVTISTAMLSPIVRGGAAAGSNLNIQSTSAAGTTDFIRFATGNAGNHEALRISTLGYSGFGSTTPWAQVSIATSSTSTIPLFAIGYSSNNNVTSPTTTPFIVDQNGRVGVGTSSPWGLLSINASSTIFAPSGPLFVIGSSTLSNATFIIDSSGRTGVGTSSPWAGFSINPDIYIGNGPIFAIGSTSSAGTRLVMDNIGRTGIGSSSPWAILSVSANVQDKTVPQFAVGSSTATAFLIDNINRIAIGTSTMHVNGGLTVGTTTTFVNSQFGGVIASSTDQSATITVDWSKGNMFRQLLTTNTTLVINATSSNPRDGFKYILKLCQDGTGSRTVTFSTGPSLVWEGGNRATTTVASGANDVTFIGMTYDGRTQRYDILASSTSSGEPRSCVP